MSFLILTTQYEPTICIINTLKHILGRKDSKEKMELTESLVSRDRGDRGAPGMMGLKKDKGNEGSRGRCFRNSLNWPIYIISSVDKTKLSFNTPHRSSTTVTQLPFLNI